MQLLETCKPQATCEIQSRVPTSLHNLEYFFTLSHTLPLHDSHLNTRLLIAKIQANLSRNKANKMVDKIQPYTFKYEQLLNICYWCGRLDQNDRDCELWIESEGTLTTNNQAYGPWIRASHTPNPCSSVIVVPGFYEARKKKVPANKNCGIPIPTLVVESPINPTPDGQFQNMDTSNFVEVVRLEFSHLMTKNPDLHVLGDSLGGKIKGY